MGFAIEKESAGDWLFDMNRDLNNQSVWANRFGRTSHTQQVVQAGLDQQYSSSLMNTYETFLQNQGQIGSMGLISGIREDLTQANMESLSRAYQMQLSEHRGQTMQLFESYLRAQGVIGEELMDQARIYADFADSFFDYMASGNLTADFEEYLTIIGVMDEFGELSAHTLRNIMFQTTTELNEDGTIKWRQGDMTAEGRMIMNMLQANRGVRGEGDEMVRLLGYEEWLRDVSGRDLEGIDQNVMRQMMGIVGEEGRTYSPGEMMAISATYNQHMRDKLARQLEELRLDRNSTWISIMNNNTFDIRPKDIERMSADFAASMEEVTNILIKFDIPMEEFANFLISEGIQPMEQGANQFLDGLDKQVISDLQRGLYTTAQVVEAAAWTAVAVASAVLAKAVAAAILTAGAGSGAVIAATALLSAAIISATLATAGRQEIERELLGQSRGMVQHARGLGEYQQSIFNKLDDFLANLGR